MKLKILYTFLCASFITVSCLAQSIGKDAADYINQFKNIAMQEQIRTGVPAAIKLGQAILESQTGKSKLATEANNHFGVKCKTEWKGPKIYHNDDAAGECFRVYENAEASFIDHSNFLKTRTHYSFLFKLDVTDFTSWAFGLKQAGYATNPNYPAQLIKAINDYDLAQYTLIALEQKKKGIDFIITPAPVAKNTTPTQQAEPTKLSEPSKQMEPAKIASTPTPSTPVTKTATASAPASASVPASSPTTLAPVSLLENTKVTINHTKAILATKGSSLLAIANSNKLSLDKLFDFNELAEMNILDQDRILFVEKKQKYGASEMHVTIGTETLYSIAQKEGILLSSILTLNKGIAKDSILQVGQKIKLRAELVPKTKAKKTKKGKKK
jgi:LysM repeat protein